MQCIKLDCIFVRLEVISYDEVLFYVCGKCLLAVIIIVIVAVVVCVMLFVVVPLLLFSVIFMLQFLVIVATEPSSINFNSPLVFSDRCRLQKPQVFRQYFRA